MTKREILKETELFVLDMDGTFYLDTDVIDGALDFLEEVKKAGKRYVFFTNNSSKSPKTYIDKLAKMGCYISRDQIITSGDVMIQYLKEYYPGQKVYLVGTPDLEANFLENGIHLTKEMPDVVVFGFDMTLTYEKPAHISGTAQYSLQPIWISTVRQRMDLSRTAAPCARRFLCRRERSRSTSENRSARRWTWSWS